MLLDYNRLFFDDEAITAASTYESDSLDLSASPKPFGAGELVRIWCQVTTTFAGGTNALINVITSAVAALTTPTILYATPVVLTATLVAGYRFAIPAMPVANLAQRYFGLSCTSTGTHTAGTISAGIVTNEQDHENASNWNAVTGF